MEKHYGINIRTTHPINLSRLASEIKTGYLKDEFVQEETEIYPSYSSPRSILAKNVSGDEIRFAKEFFDYYFGGALIESNILKATKSALGFAKRMSSETLRFNPNYIGLFLGWHRDLAKFKRCVVPIAITLQQRMYSGGDIYWAESSHDFSLFLGSEKEIRPRRIPDAKKIAVKGKFQPANSLDELLERIQKSKS